LASAILQHEDRDTNTQQLNYTSFIFPELLFPGSVFECVVCKTGVSVKQCDEACW